MARSAAKDVPFILVQLFEIFRRILGSLIRTYITATMLTLALLARAACIRQRRRAPNAMAAAQARPSFIIVAIRNNPFARSCIDPAIFVQTDRSLRYTCST